jgi:hypothetical protein
MEEVGFLVSAGAAEAVMAIRERREMEVERNMLLKVCGSGSSGWVRLDGKRWKSEMWLMRREGKQRR